MRNGLMHIAVSAVLIMALVLGVVVENHHHDADGSMCLCMHACHHDGLCDHHDGCRHDCGHDSHDHDDDSCCTMHLDEVSLDRHYSGSDFLPVWSVLPPGGICMPAPRATVVRGTYFRPCRLSPGRHPAPRPMRGPPAAV